MKNLTVKKFSFVTLAKGSIIHVPNPKWDCNKPKTQFYYEVTTPHSLCIKIRGSLTGPTGKKFWPRNPDTQEG